MPENNAFDGSANAGSPISNGGPNPNSFGGATGQPQNNQAPQIDPVQHANLESLVGTQGQELGEFRKFFSDIAPLLDKLDKNPEIVQAIIEDKINGDLAKAAMEGKISIEDAKIINKAQTEVKKELGAAGIQGASSEEINKLVEDRAIELKTEFQKELKERDELAAFESTVNDFIGRTSDFSKYASDIDKWLDDHSDVTDISVAYYAVKGELSVKEAQKQAEIDKAEAEKAGALNMGGGSSVGTRIRGNDNTIDSLIATKSNPNNFG
jgi:hypothetical protein